MSNEFLLFSVMGSWFNCDFLLPVDCFDFDFSSQNSLADRDVDISYDVEFVPREIWVWLHVNFESQISCWASCLTVVSLFPSESAILVERKKQ